MALKPAPMAPEGRRDPKSTKKREEWFPLARDMAKTNSSFFSPKNSTKLGIAGVSFTKNSKSAKKGGLCSKYAPALRLNNGRMNGICDRGLGLGPSPYPRHL
jgi:hypothetical protein